MRKKFLSLLSLGAVSFLFTSCTVKISIDGTMPEINIDGMNISSYISDNIQDISINIAEPTNSVSASSLPMEEPDVITTDIPPQDEPTGIEPSIEPSTEPSVETPTREEELIVENKPIVKTVQYIKVLAEGLNVRRAPSVTSEIIGQTNAGMGMVYLGKEGDFYKTYYLNTVAYVSANSKYTTLYNQTISENEKIENVIMEGCKLLGIDYVYGAVRYHDGKGNKLSGFTTEKFDCSSLMQYIFYKGAGVLLDVTTRTQVLQGVKIEKADLKRGDLMFFTNSTRYNNTGIERVGHVALYLGDNLILHTASDYARIEELNSTRWGYFLEARRVL